MKNTALEWTREYSIETSAPPETLWRIFGDVPGWKKWNAGIERIEMHGPFSVGSEFLMQPPGQEPVVSRLIEVRENESFVDETRVNDLIVRVAHRIVRLSAHRSRVTFTVEAIGPDCAEIGSAVSSDFPDVLQSLVSLAES